jgi:hypothetical protein
MAEPGVVEAEVSSLIALSGLMLVFLPFFLDRVRGARERLSRVSLRRMTLLIWLTALLVGLPAIASAFGLLTIWRVVEASGLVGWMTLISMCLLVTYTLVTVWLETQVWT